MRSLIHLYLRTLKTSTIILLILVLALTSVMTLHKGVSAAGPLTVDKTVIKKQTSASSSVTTSSFSTNQVNELLVAFINVDGPSTSGSQSVTAVTGGGLSWSLKKRVNTQYGDTEIWQAVASNKLTNVSVKATFKYSMQSMLTVVSFINADLSNNGAVGSNNAASGAPNVSLTATRNGSWVWGAGNDWDYAKTRVVGSEQTKVSEMLASVGDTFWVQRQNSATSVAGQLITLNDISPTTDRWNFASIEILPATDPVPDTTPPTPPINLTATASSRNVGLNWSPSTDNISVTGYRVNRDGAQIGTATNNNYIDTTVITGMQYTYSVQAFDAANNTSAESNTVTILIPSPDITPPTVSITLPSPESTLSGSVTITADAGDNIAVSGVQFKVDGLAVGPEDTTSPYSIVWNTLSVSNGAHQILAIARDSSGNITNSLPVDVNVNNAPPSVSNMPIISRNKPAYAQNGTASYANDDDYDSAWSSTTNSSWLAYDLSTIPASNRQNVILAWYSSMDDGHSVNGFQGACPAWSGRPYIKDYVIEVNSASGGSVPTSGWQTLVTVTGNGNLSAQHMVNMASYNWIRINGSGPNGISVNVDIIDASQGVTDGWLFLGDSITAAYAGHYSTNVTANYSSLISSRTNGSFTPYHENAAMSCTKSADALVWIDSFLSAFQGKYVTLNFGTNDGWNGTGDPAYYYDNMQSLVNKIRSHGKVAVVSTIPWPNTNISWANNTESMNSKIFELYANNPDIVRGPDLYTITKNHPEYYRANGDVHFNDTGNSVARNAWASAALANIYNK